VVINTKQLTRTTILLYTSCCAYDPFTNSTITVVLCFVCARERERYMEFEGDCSLWHHLIFYEELESDEENFIICRRCQEPLWGGPTYKCLECNFHQHKSCTEDIEIDEHDFGERHHLISVEELDKYNGGMEEVVCPGCQELGFGPAYKCSFPKCTFFLHKSCSEQLSHVVQHNMHPEHALFLQLPSSSNYCHVCYEYCHNSLFYRCFTGCHFDIDIKCFSRWQISAEDCEKHSLFPMRKQIQFTCEACAEESMDIAYQCSVCRVLIHLLCDRFPHTIKISTHDHSLTRTYTLHQVKKQENVLCRLCRKKVNTEYAAYYCRKCDYIAHMECANYYKVEDGDQSETPEVDANQLVHLVEGIDVAEDERASPREINHFSHPQHNLILSNERLVDVKRCEACIQFILSTPFYSCAQCNFFLHYRCTKLPATIKRGLIHNHPLTLLPQDVNASGLFWCGACERYHHGFVYTCDECKWYNLDVQCCLIPEILEHKGHQHSLNLVIASFSETCNGCGKKGVNFRCTHCDEFTLCFRCATFPLVARYEYHAHLLKLSYTREDDSDEEYYCLICEEERDHPDHWFYSCVKCKFTAHFQCVIGENPCINYGRTFIDKDHEHPLAIVQKTKHSPPCDACGNSFVDMALVCSQCKFNVHTRRGIWQEISCLPKQSTK
jgi:hypothetical protein